MNHRTAETLLRFYPVFYRQITDHRDGVLDGCLSSSLANTGRHGTGGYADPTATRAMKMVALGESMEKLSLVPRYMDTLPPEQRAFILSVWRCSILIWEYTDWSVVARRMGMRLAECCAIWLKLVANFRAYATPASELAGIASAGGQQSQSLE